MYRLRIFLVLSLSVFLSKKAFVQDVVINEFMSSNYERLLDHDGDDSDWIEIYNRSDDTVDLSGFFLSDNSDKLDKWRFPEIEILPDSFLVVFASGKDTIFSNNEIHTSFSISSVGEPLFLFDGAIVIHEFESLLL